MHSLVACAGLLVALEVPARAQAWERIDQQDGIEVFRKAVPGTDIVAFRGATVMDVGVGRLLYVLMDNEHRTQWVDRLALSRVLERVGPHEVVLYQQFKLPAILSDRDYVYRMKVDRVAGGAIRLRIASQEHPAAPPTVGVRARLVRSSYLLTPLGPHQTRVEVEVLTDPKGWVPAWAVNRVQKSWPLKTLRGLRDQSRKAYVSDYPLPTS